MPPITYATQGKISIRLFMLFKKKHETNRLIKESTTNHMIVITNQNPIKVNTPIKYTFLYRYNLIFKIKLLHVSSLRVARGRTVLYNKQSPSKTI